MDYVNKLSGSTLRSSSLFLRIGKCKQRKLVVDSICDELIADRKVRSRVKKLKLVTEILKEWAFNVTRLSYENEVKKLAYSVASCRPFAAYSALKSVNRRERKTTLKPLVMTCKNVNFCPHCFARRVYPIFQTVSSWEQASLHRLVVKDKYNKSVDHLKDAIKWLRRSISRKYSEHGYLMIRPIFKSHAKPALIEIVAVSKGDTPLPASLRKLIVTRSRGDVNKQVPLFCTSRSSVCLTGEKIMDDLSAAFYFPAERVNPSLTHVKHMPLRLDFLRKQTCITEFNRGEAVDAV